MAQLGNLIVNGVTRLLSKLYVSDSVTAPTFIGKLTGNADSATKLSSSAGSVTQPVYFSDGKPVATTYTLAKSVPADAKFTDTNTWRGVQNNLTSTATDQSLSAAQGKALKDLVDGKAAASHTHDDRYYTETEIDTKLSGKANSSHTHTKDQVGLGNVDNTADSAKSVKYATSAGSASSSSFLGKNATFNKTGQAGIQYYDAEIKGATSVSTDGWGSPTEAWYQIIHMPLSVSNYYNDIAIPVNDTNGLAYRQRRNGNYYGWYRIVDSNNWKTYITKSGLGLDKVNNTADADKSVKYATTAGTANAVAWSNVSDKPTTFTPASHTHSAFGKATADAAGSAGFVPAPAKGQQGLYLRGDGAWATPTNTTYGVASTSANGLMSSTDKSKLDGIANGANNYSLPTASSSTLGGVKTTSSVTSTSGLTASPIINGVVYYKDTNTTYGLASQSSGGLMSASDKTKLDGIASGANNITVDSYLSSSSTNPVQNKVVYSNNLWLYRATLYVSSWTTSGDSYYQWASITAVDGGPGVTSSTILSSPMTIQTNSSSTNETLQAALDIINRGYTVVNSAGAYVYVWEKPTSDIPVYWYAR